MERNGVKEANGAKGMNGVKEVNGFDHINEINGATSPNDSTDHSKHSNPLASTHSLLVYDLFKKFQYITRVGSVKVNGESLDIPAVVAVSRYK